MSKQKKANWKLLLNSRPVASLFCIANCTLIALLIWNYFQKSKNNIPLAAAVDTSTKQIQVRGHDLNQLPKLGEDAHDSRSHLIASFHPSSLNAEDIAKINISKFGPLREKVFEWLEDEPDEALKWLDETSKALSEMSAPVHAYTLLESHSEHLEIRDLQRLAVHEWMGDDVLSTFEHIRKSAFNGTTIGVFDKRLASIAASVATTEHSSQLGTVTEYIRGMTAPELARAKGALIGKLLTHSNEDNFATIKSLVEDHLENPYVVANVIPIAEKLSAQNPIEALDWSSSLRIENKELHATAFSSVFETISSNDPELASEILSGDNFLKRYYPGEATDADGAWTGDAKSFFDLTLSSYIDRLLAYDPESAIESVQAFFDEELANEYVGIIEDTIKRIEERGPSG